MFDKLKESFQNFISNIDLEEFKNASREAIEYEREEAKRNYEKIKDEYEVDERFINLKSKEILMGKFS